MGRPSKLQLVFIVLGILLFLVDVRQHRNLRASYSSQEQTILSKHHALDSLGLTAESVLLDDDTSIRSWGCDLTATPFIFVHIGKAGGGIVRRRIAAAALNITRPKSAWGKPKFDDHYYPVATTTQHDNASNNNNKTRTTIHRAKFCSSKRYRHQPGEPHYSFEGFSQQCSAKSPLGHILACPEMFNEGCDYYHPKDPNSAHIVYTGHNFLGTELHWLPIPYLQKWWSTYWSSIDNKKEDPVLRKMDTLDGVQPWCESNRRPILLEPVREDRAKYWSCARSHVQPQADAWAAQAVSERLLGSDSSSSFAKRDNSDQVLRLTDGQQGRAWGQLYASMPVMRVTVLREPFSWLSSKYAWHKLGQRFDTACDDLELATQFDINNSTGLNVAVHSGWARHMPLVYIFSLCGEDCHTRMELGEASLAQVEAQAAYNLRNSFAVVGLLHEQDTFFDMMHARIDYMNMREVDEVHGGSHKSKKDEYCEARFRDPQYQKQMLAVSPELAALKRLYEIGVEVNRFQMRELEQCSGMSLVPKVNTDDNEDEDEEE